MHCSMPAVKLSKVQTQLNYIQILYLDFRFSLVSVFHFKPVKMTANIIQTWKVNRSYE